MTKQELVDYVATATETSRAETERIVNATLKAIEDALVAEDAVDLHPLGRFVVATEPAHAGTDPNTHAPITIPARTAVRFHVSQALKSALPVPPAA